MHSNEREFQALLFDADGVLYHHPRHQFHLASFLAGHGLVMRSAAFVERALRAARFDVLTGRIRRETYYDAVLRVHGVFDETAFPAGREALLRDAADIELYPGVPQTLARLHGAGVHIGVVTDSECPAGEHIAWLAARRVSPGVWSTFVVSPDAGVTTAEPAIFQQALAELALPADRVAYVGHETAALATAARLGLMTIGFMPDDPLFEVDREVSSIYELADCFRVAG